MICDGNNDKIKDYIDYYHPMFIDTNKNNKDYLRNLSIMYRSR
jgi:hypothetical protein